MPGDGRDEAIEAAAREIQARCEHFWERVGFQERSPVILAVVYVCEKCSSYTYREVTFVGFRLSSLVDHVSEVVEKG